jgi:hypothetical protein
VWSIPWGAACAAAGAESATQRDELPLPLEYLAAHRELLLAFKLLEADGLKVWPSMRLVQCGIKQLKTDGRLHNVLEDRILADGSSPGAY